MDIEYHIGKMTCDMDDGIVEHVEWFRREFESGKEGYLRDEAGRIERLLAVMDSYRSDRTVYPLLARLLGYYLKDVKERRDEEEQGSSRSEDRSEGGSPAGEPRIAQQDRRFPTRGGSAPHPSMPVPPASDSEER